MESACSAWGIEPEMVCAPNDGGLGEVRTETHEIEDFTRGLPELMYPSVQR
jgi:hypothetical protein